MYIVLLDVEISGSYIGSFTSLAPSQLTPRKNFWGSYMDYAHLKGIGGPGAPHAFKLQRVEDAGMWGNKFNLVLFI